MSGLTSESEQLVYRIEHREIREGKGRFFLGPWAENAWKNFPDFDFAYAMILEFGEAIASWEDVVWEGIRVNDFCLDEFGSSFNNKYIAGVERLEDLNWLAPYWEFLKQAGFCLRVYSVPKEYVVRATRWQRRAIYYDSCSGLVNQCAFHWYRAKLLEEINYF